ncbi:MAG TPA: CAP domain-containing protein [Solirubrobacteraceae bacterium]
MGVRETSKLLSAALLTVLLLLAGVLASTALAHTAGKAHHRGSGASGHSHRVRGDRAKILRSRVRAHEQTPKPAKQHVARKRERTPGPAPASAAKPDAAAAAASIATVLATPCQNTELTPQPGNIALAREAVLCLINHERAEHSIASLKTNGELEAAAEDHNAEMIRLDYFAHVAPDGETPVERIKKTGYIAGESVGYVIGENLAWGTYTLATPKAIVEAWIASPGHLANILESRYTETGIGVTPAVPESLGEGNPGATYAQEFGVIVH